LTDRPHRAVTVSKMARCNLILCCSSTGFACAGLFGFYMKEYILAVVASLTCVASTLYWSDESPGWRHNTDRVVAKCSFLIYTAYGTLCVKDWRILAVGWPCWLGVVGFFGLSKLAHQTQHSGWVYAHALFHTCVSIGQCLVIAGVAECRGCRALDRQARGGGAARLNKTLAFDVWLHMKRVWTFCSGSAGAEPRHPAD
jgi:hypothetical protein